MSAPFLTEDVAVEDKFALFEKLLGVLSGIRTETTLEGVKTRTCGAFRDLLGAEAVSLFLMDSQSRRLRCHVTTDPSARYVGGFLDLGEDDIHELAGAGVFWTADRKLVVRLEDKELELSGPSIVAVPLILLSNVDGLLLAEFGEQTFNKDVKTQATIEMFLNVISPVVGLISERHRLEDKTKTLELLYDVSHELSQAKEDEDLLDRIMALIESRLHVDRCSLMIVEPDRKTLRIRRAFGMAEIRPEKVKIVVGEGIAGAVAASGKPLLIRDLESEAHLRKSGSQYRTNSLLSVPLIGKGVVIGVINVNNRKDGRPFAKDDLQVLTVIGAEIASALQRSYIEAQLKKAIDLDRDISRSMI